MSDLTSVWVASDSTQTKFRGWDDDVGGFCWVTDEAQALWFARRSDVEKVFAQDEDCWGVLMIEVALPAL